MSERQQNAAQLNRRLMRFFLDQEIANFYGFLKILDEGLVVRRQELSKNIDITENGEEWSKELINLKVEAEQIKGFTNLLRQSFLTSLYSFMELWLMRECHLDSKRKDSGHSYKSTQGKGIEKAKKYFVTVMKSDYPFGTSQDWFWIKNFQLLRDCIIHRQGSLTGFSDFKVDDSLAKFVESEQGLSLFGPENKQIFVEYEFCLKSLHIVHRFMVNILALETETV